MRKVHAAESKRESKVKSRKGLWRNGNASDYESEDCRFDPCQARLFDKSKGKSGGKKKGIGQGQGEDKSRTGISG